MQGERSTATTQHSLMISPGSRFRTAMILAIIADALQIVIFLHSLKGTLSPADDILDFGVAALLINLLMNLLLGKEKSNEAHRNTLR